MNLHFDDELMAQYKRICELVGDCGATHAMIAGGAIRDMLLHKPIKDIDVFYEGILDLGMVEKVFKLPPKPTGIPFFDPFAKTIVNVPQPQDEFPLEFYPENSDWKVTNSRVYMEGCPYPIQLILVKDVSTHLRTFGASISKVAMFADGGMFLDEGFIRDVNTKTLHIDPNCAEKYQQKILAKFEEYEAVHECMMS